MESIKNIESIEVVDKYECPKILQHSSISGIKSIHYRFGVQTEILRSWDLLIPAFVKNHPVGCTVFKMLQK